MQAKSFLDGKGLLAIAAHKDFAALQASRVLGYDVVL